MASTASHSNLRPDPCPTCGKDVTNISAYQDEPMLSMSDDHSTPPPARFTLVPCGHDVDSYTVDTVRQTVTWNETAEDRSNRFWRGTALESVDSMLAASIEEPARYGYTEPEQYR